MQKIVQAFFGQGKLLTPEALKYLENKDFGRYLYGSPGLVVDIEDLMSKEDKIRIIKNITEKMGEITTGDIVRFYNSKYEKMQNIILARLQKDFISINKLGSYSDEVFVIGIVRSIRDAEGKKHAELEDPTGSVTAIFEAGEGHDIELDDVVAVQGVSGRASLFAKKALYPDVPLRQPTKGAGKACFISSPRLDEAPRKDMEKFMQWFEKDDTKYLFVVGKIGDTEAFGSLAEDYCRNKKIFTAASRDGSDLPWLPQEFGSKNVIPLSNPSMVELNGIKILLTEKFDVKMLRKRHIGNIKPVIPEDAMALDEVPDIVHHATGMTANVSNYKSITIINAGSLLTSFQPVVVDFASRDFTQINLSAHDKI